MPRYRTGKPPPLDDLLKDVAEHGGLFTTHQAEQRGISKQLLSYHVKQGKLERVAHGVYRSPYASTSRHEDVIARVLPYGEGAVASGPTALDIYDVGQLAPDKVYVKQQPDTPSGPIPSAYHGGTVSIQAREQFPVHYREGVPVEGVADALYTTSVYTYYDKDQVASAIDDALDRGLISQADATKIRKSKKDQP